MTKLLCRCQQASTRVRAASPDATLRALARLTTGHHQSCSRELRRFLSNSWDASEGIFVLEWRRRKKRLRATSSTALGTLNPLNSYNSAGGAQITKSTKVY